MCFSATVNFAGGAVLGAAGVATLTKVRHRRELLFAAMPLLFAIHQYIGGFVWLGLDGVLSPSLAGFLVFLPTSHRQNYAKFCLTA